MTAFFFFFCHIELSSQRVKEQTASLRRSNINHVTPAPARPYVSMMAGSSRSGTPGCRGNVNNGKKDAH